MAALRERTEIELVEREGLQQENGKKGTIAARKALAAYRQMNKSLRVPVPVEDLAMALGYRIVLLTTVPDEFSALISPAEMLIGVNRNHHVHRRRFSVGHEIGHLLLGHPPEADCTPYEAALHDLEADACASELLMPEELLLPMAQKFPKPERLAQIFQVSAEAMHRRLERLADEFV